MKITGSKAAMGVWQRIVSLLPAHRLFIEAFAGGAAVTRYKRPCELTLLLERDPVTAGELRRSLIDADDDRRRRAAVIVADSLEVLQVERLPADCVLYCDPPYMLESRRDPTRRYYRHDWNTADHRRFLDWVQKATCPTVISGYASGLYDVELAAWRRLAFRAGTRHGPALEHVWCNFSPPPTFHDTRHVGAGFVERQRIKRKAARWLAKLDAMPADERAAILQAILERHSHGQLAVMATIDADDCEGPPSRK